MEKARRWQYFDFTVDSMESLPNDQGHHDPHQDGECYFIHSKHFSNQILFII